MGSSIKQGQSIFIPFVNGESVPDSQNRPRMYKTVEQYEKNSRVFHDEIPILIEYVPEEKKDMENPLTLEELRKMDGKPVWIQRNDPPHDGKWDLVDYADTENPDKTLYTKSGVTYSEYGKYFTAYAYEPPCLDRSAWEPCAECRSCDNCKNSSDYDPDEGIYGECGRCHEYSNFEPCNFCRECGRPLTDAAWKMLERRLAGRDKR